MREILEDIKDRLWSPERRLDLLQIAKKHRYSFKNSQAFLALDIDLKNFHFFGQNKKHKLKYIVSQKIEALGGSVRVIDFHPKGAQKKVFSVVVIESALLDLPAFRIETRSNWDFLKNTKSSRKIEFMGFPDFNKRYRIYTSSTDRKMKDLLKEEFLDFLMEQQSFYLEANNQFVLFADKTKPRASNEIPQLMKDGKKIGRLLLKESLGL